MKQDHVGSLVTRSAAPTEQVRVALKQKKTCYCEHCTASHMTSVAVRGRIYSSLGRTGIDRDRMVLINEPTKNPVIILAALYYSKAGLYRNGDTGLRLVFVPTKLWPLIR